MLPLALKITGSLFVIMALIVLQMYVQKCSLRLGNWFLNRLLSKKKT